MTAVEAVGLVKRYDGVEALRGVSLRLEGGAGVLLGPNGSGKSTLLKIAAGVAVPDGGRLEVFGAEPYRDRGVKQVIGYMPQDSGLYGQLTGLENYLFYAALQGVPRGEALERLEEIRGPLGLGEWFERRRVAGYSGGMKRKTSFALALAHGPRLLVLDEPTTGLDPGARRELWGVLEGLLRSGVTALLATHLFEDAEYLATRVFVMREGRVVAAGSPEELKARAGKRYAVDVELARRPGEEILGRLRGIGEVFASGYRVTVLSEDEDALNSVEAALRDERVVSISLRRITLGDIYFLLTGVTLQ